MIPAVRLKLNNKNNNIFKKDLLYDQKYRGLTCLISRKWFRLRNINRIIMVYKMKVQME